MAKEKGPSQKMLAKIATAGSFIPYTQAAALTADWRAHNGDLPPVIDKKTGKPKKPKGKVKAKDYFKGFYLDRKNLDILLAQENCTGIRVYMGMKKKKDMTVLIVGTELGPDGVPNDMVPPAPTKAKKGEPEVIYPLIIDDAAPCPTMCGSKNALNA